MLRRNIPLTAGAGLLAVLLHGAAPAGERLGLIGYEYSRGGGSQETHSVLAAGGVELPRGDVIAGLMRFRDRQVGSGFGFVLGGGYTLGPRARLRIVGSRFEGDDRFSAWRIRVGPLWALPSGGRMGLHFTRDGNSFGNRSNGGAWELTHPLSSRTETSVTVYVDRSRLGSGRGFAVGLSRSLTPKLELAGDLGVANSARGVLGPGLALRTDDAWTATTSIALRRTLP